MSDGREKRVKDEQASKTDRRLPVLLAGAGVLLLAFGLMVSSATRKSATVDEQSHLFRGIAYLSEGATHFLLGHPLLGGSLSALPLLTETDLHLPVDTPAWEAGDWSVAGDHFLWRLNDDPLRLIFLGRLPVIWLTLLLGALVFRWAAEWAGPSAGAAAGLVGMALIMLDPNVLAHGRFITGDLPLVLFFTMALYGFWQWLRSSGWQIGRGFGFLKERPALYLLVSGAGLGMAAATKFNAALLGPILLLWAAVHAWQKRSARPLLALAVVGLVGWFTIWVVYGFSLWRGVIPGGAFWADVVWQLTYVGGRHGVYLLGQVSPNGWLAYFPIAFGLKTPLPTLVLLGVALILVLRRRAGWAALFLLIPAVIYFIGSMVVALNIGYRYLLPILPLTSVLIATVIIKADPVRRRPLIWVAVLVGLFAALTLWIWPDYVPYFNVLGGSDSWRILSDSNVDWGQDLTSLGQWQRDNDEELKLSYFGTAHPSAYGVSFEPLPTWAPAPEQGDPSKQAFYPPDPAPGTYAISVTNLHGVVLGEARNSFEVFRDVETEDRIGGSIFIYQVASRGEPVDVAFSDLTPAEIEPEIHERFDTNDVRVRWLDAKRSLIFPAEGGYLVGWEEVAPWFNRIRETRLESPEMIGGQVLYRLPEAPELAWEGAGARFGDGLTFLGSQGLSREGQVISLLTAWRVERPTERPLKIFVHALDSSGQISGQWDGLDVDPGSWRAGDVFIQAHEITLPAGVSPVEVSIGVYDGESGERLGMPVILPLEG